MALHKIKNKKDNEMNIRQELFEYAVEHIKRANTFGKGPSYDENLQFYGFYKQVTIGKCNTAQPWIFQLEERPKWDAWNALGNMSKETAMNKYCELYDTIRFLIPVFYMESKI